MIDPLTVGAAAAGLLALDPVKKLLGPTADYWGAELASYTKRRFSNAEKIIEIAADHAKDDPDPKKTVPPRVFLAAIEEGSKVEDDLAMRYFGGVLAASRNKDGKDDDSVMYTALLARLPAFQMRLHYILYSLFRHKWKGQHSNLSSPDGRSKCRTAIGYNIMTANLGEKWIVDTERHVFNLYREGLVDNFAYGNYFQSETGNPEQFLEFVPTVLGCNLYLSAIGSKRIDASALLQDQLPEPEMTPVTFGKVYASDAIPRIIPAV